jgi:hypothetical protein
MNPKIDQVPWKSMPKEALPWTASWYKPLYDGIAELDLDM